MTLAGNPGHIKIKNGWLAPTGSSVTVRHLCLAGDPPFAQRSRQPNAVTIDITGC
jgi:hypothetical protein